MKKILLTLCALLTAMGTWADNILVSTTVGADAEYQYKIYCRAASNYYLGSTTNATTSDPGLFAFYADQNHTNGYYIYSITDGQWVTYTVAASYSEGQNKVVMSAEKPSYPWHIAADNINSSFYDVRPFQSNGNVDGLSWNWHGGAAYNTSNTMGFYSYTDANSGWGFTLNNSHYTVHVMGSVDATAGVTYSGTDYTDANKYIFTDATLTTSDLEAVAVAGENATVSINSKDIYVVYTPSLSGYYVTNTTAAPTTDAIVEGQWYILTQLRDGESPAYDAAAGKTMMRATSSVTPAQVLTTNQQVSTVKDYLIRFKKSGMGDAYNIQFATGNFWNGTASSATAWVSYLVYTATQTADSSTGWALNNTTDGNTYADKVDNNGAGGTISYWGSGKTTSGTNNIWKIYPATLEAQSLSKLKSDYIANHQVADESKLGQLGYPTSEGKTDFEAAINAIPSVAAFDEASATALEDYKATIVYPSNGAYYIKNANTGCYAYAKDGAEAVTRINKDSEATHTSNNYIWTVTNNSDGTFAINNLYNRPFTKANLNNFTTTNTTAISHVTTNPFGSFAGKFYLEGAHNNNVYSTPDATGFVVNWAYETSEGSHWVFEPVEVSYPYYTVTVQNIDAGLDPVSLSDGTVLNEGTANVYWSGTMEVSDITQNSFTYFTIPAENPIVIDDHNVTITYNAAYQEMMTAYMTENAISEKLAMAGKVGAPKTSTTSYTNLKALVDDIENQYNKVGWTNLKTYYAAYFNETDVVMPEVGKFYTIYQPTAGKYIHAVTANASTPLAASTDGTSADAIFYIPASCRFIAYSKGYSMVNNVISGTLYASGGICTYDLNHYASHPIGTLRLKKGDAYLYATSESNVVGITSSGEDASKYWKLEEVTSLPVTISTAQYATFWAPVAVTIPSGVKAYCVSELSDTEATLTEITTTIPASTPVVLKATSTLETATTFDFDITTSGAFEGTNKLAGQAATIAFAEGSYTLQKRSGGSDVGFFPTTTTSGTLAGFKAYLPSSAFAAGAKGFTFRFDMPTLVEAIEAAQNPDKVVYDMSGRRVQNPAKGIFIVDGKKVVIK